MFGYQKQIKLKNQGYMFWHRLLVFSWSRSLTGVISRKPALLDWWNWRENVPGPEMETMTEWPFYPAIMPSSWAPDLFCLKKTHTQKKTKIPEKASETGTNYRLPSKKTFRTGCWALVYLETAGERGRAQSVSRCNNPIRPYPVFLSFCPNVLPVSRSQPNAAMSILHCFA